MRWVNRMQLSDETGVATRTLNEIARREPGTLVTRVVRGKVEYQQPACAVRLRDRAVRLALAAQQNGTSSLAKARERKEDAAAQLRELELAERRGELMPVELHASRFRDRCEELAGCVKGLGVWVERIRSAPSDDEAFAIGEQMEDALLAALRGTADHIPDVEEDAVHV